MKTQTVMLGLTAAFSLLAFGEELPTNGSLADSWPKGLL
jgi:hypothetical protein